MEKSGFKIIGVQILDGCADYIQKKLKANVFYYLYNEYVCDKEHTCRESHVISDDFFTRDIAGANKQINICAIVGKNGDGKSTLVDIVIRLINNLSYKCAYGCSALYKSSPKWIAGVRAFMIYSIGDDIYKIEQNSDEEARIQLYKLDALNHWEIVEINRANIEASLFYSVILDYSLYAFNSYDYAEEWTPDINGRDPEDGSWIKAISHKNDGYQIPLALNPMRTEGNMDINIENHLTKDRLISLIFKEGGKQNTNFTRINNHTHISSIHISLAKDSVLKKYERIKQNFIKESDDRMSVDDFALLHEAILSCWRDIYPLGRQTNRNEQYELATKYLVYKTINVAWRYDVFTYDYALSPSEDFSRRERFLTLKKLIKEIDNDRSHITFRIRQTLALLVNRHLQCPSGKVKKYTVDEFSEIADRIQKKARDKERRWELLDLVPPPCFNVDLYVKDNIADRSEFLFTKLSSGERQMIYMVSTILYHIRNINSIEKGPARVKYSHINLIMDEIELYYHPDYQKRLVNHLLESLFSMSFDDIKSINVIMITHSPFILSDIPKQNVLFIKDGLPYNEMQENTFGSNIHSLLQNGFFLEDGTIGDFAKCRINRMFEELHKNNELPSWLKNEILLVSEPFIRSQLLRMYNERNPEYRELELLKARVKELTERLNNIEKHNK